MLFSVTLFVSAGLLFSVQPMIGKMILPKLGGTPAVWNSCMVFFQAALLLGYAYAHLLARLGIRRQTLIHLGLISLPFFVLPIQIGGKAVMSIPSENNPVPWLLGFLVVSTGLPFVVVSATAPPPMVFNWPIDLPFMKTSIELVPTNQFARTEE